MITVHDNPRHLKVTFDKDKGYVLFKWTDFSIPPGELKAVHRKALDILLENGCRDYIADTSEATNVLYQEIIAWWKNEWVPVLIKAGIRIIVTVLPQSALAVFVNREWHGCDYGSIILKNAGTLKEAEGILKDPN